MICSVCAHAAAQGSIWIDATTSTAQPPGDVIDASSSAYLLVGLRGELPKAGWRLASSANFGSSFGQDEGRWLLADAIITRNWFGARQSFSLGANGFALRYTDPFEYTAYATELQPALTLRSASWQLALIPRATGGAWSSDTIDGDIRVFGGSAQLANAFGPLLVAVNGEAHDAVNGALDGSYAGVGADVSMAVGRFAMGGGVKRWQNPSEHEWGYSAFASMQLASGLVVDARLARSVTDPVLASPGSFGASIGLSWRLFSSHRKEPVPVARVASTASSGRSVSFTVEVTADSVALSGSFTEWKPIPMRKKGRSFTVEMVVPAGTHQYGFLLNGKDWYIPPNALGIVDDGFGRKNATLVIER